MSDERIRPQVFVDALAPNSARAILRERGRYYLLDLGEDNVPTPLADEHTAMWHTLRGEMRRPHRKEKLGVRYRYSSAPRAIAAIQQRYDRLREDPNRPTTLVDPISPDTLRKWMND